MIKGAQEKIDGYIIGLRGVSVNGFIFLGDFCRLKINLISL
jgi:hypothetical protein